MNADSCGSRSTALVYSIAMHWSSVSFFCSLQARQVRTGPGGLRVVQSGASSPPSVRVLLGTRRDFVPLPQPTPTLPRVYEK